MTERETLEQLARESIYAFVRLTFTILQPGVRFKAAPHIEAICFALERITSGECKRLIITVPPRYMKSITVAVAFCAWYMARDPTKKVMIANYSETIAGKHGRMFRTLIRDTRFKRVYPAFKAAFDTIAEMETTLGGGRKTASLDGSTTGFGAHMIIIDDLMKPVDAKLPAMRQKAKDFFDETLFSRLEDKENGIIIAIMQRLHEDDPVQHLLDKGVFEHLNLPAIATERQSIPLYFGRTFERHPGDVLAPEYESRETLNSIRETMGDPAFSAQYQQDPTPPGGNRMRWEWFPTYRDALPRRSYQYVVQSIDTAFSEVEGSDFSVCLTFGFTGEVWQLIDIYRRRVKYTVLLSDVLSQFRRWQPDLVIIEKMGLGWALIDDMIEGLGPGHRGKITYARPEVDKEARVEVQCVKLERGLVAVPEQAPWRDEFRKEILGFPNARHDDMVDALTQFLDWVGSRHGRSALVPRAPDGRKLSVKRRDTVKRRGPP